MQSEVRKVLDTNAYYITGGVYEKLDAAERADAAKREEQVQAMRKAIAELTVDWRTKLEISEAKNTYTDKVISRLISELMVIIATKPEGQQVTASAPSVTFGASPKLTLPAGAPADEHIRAIAEQAVRDAMTDVLDGVADAIHGCGFTVGVNGLRGHAAKLRKERGA